MPQWLLCRIRYALGVSQGAFCVYDLVRGSPLNQLFFLEAILTGTNHYVQIRCFKDAAQSCHHNVTPVTSMYITILFSPKSTSASRSDCSNSVFPLVSVTPQQVPFRLDNQPSLPSLVVPMLLLMGSQPISTTDMTELKKNDCWRK